MKTVRLLLVTATVLVAWLVIPSVATAQLPPEAVDLSLVKIPEVQKSTDLDPVLLVPSAADGETWEYDGVSYRAAESGSKAEFMKDPAGYAAKAAEQRWKNNFMMAMSTIWCPITDEVTPGGRKQVEGLGYKWESCCSFCDEEMQPENFGEALERLQQRADESFELTGGVYVNDASSPVEGAIRDDF